MTQKLVKLITLHEGKVLSLYRCTAGKQTIGVGHNIEDRGISNAAADFILQEDISEAVHTLRDRIGGFDELDEVRQAVLIDMCFNLGWPRLSGFRRFIAAVEAGDFMRAALEMLDSKWSTQVGERARRLAAMMQTGQWPNEVA